MTIKDLNKRDIKFKEAYVKEGKFFDEGVETDLIDVLTSAYGDDTVFTLTISSKTEDEIDIQDLD